MLSLNKWALAGIVALALGVGSGFGGVGVTDVEGQMRVHIRSGVEGSIKGGPVGGPYAAGPFLVGEGSTLAFVACCVVDPTGGPVTMDWDLDYDGHEFVSRASGPGPVTRLFRDGPGDYVVALRLSSPNSGVTLVTQEVSVLNRPPVANVGGPYSGRATLPIVFAASATDPSDVDSTGGFNYEWDYEYNGTFAADQSGANLVSPSHTYATPGTYTVALRVTDKDGATSAIATAPVTVSTRTTLLTLNASADTWVDEDNKNNNHGSEPNMDVRSWSDNTRVSLVRFDTSSLPASATIVSAKLKLYAGVVPSVTRTYDVRRIMSNWAESTSTWQNQPEKVGNYTSRASTPATPEWMTWDVTTDLQAFMNGIVNNYGWMVLDATGGSSPAFYGSFGTRECATASLRPVLEITYLAQ